MSGSEEYPELEGLRGVLSATSVFPGYRVAAIVTYVISDVALVGAAAAYVFVDLRTALAIGLVAVIFTLIALRCGQIVFAQRTYERRVPDGEVIAYELGARRAVPVSWLRSPMLVIVTDQAVHAFVLSVFPHPAVASGVHSAGVSLRQSPTSQKGVVDLQIGDQVIGLRGLSAEKVEEASELLG